MPLGLSRRAAAARMRLRPGRGRSAETRSLCRPDVRLAAPRPRADAGGSSPPPDAKWFTSYSFRIYTPASVYMQLVQYINHLWMARRAGSGPEGPVAARCGNPLSAPAVVLRPPGGNPPPAAATVLSRGRLAARH